MTQVYVRPPFNLATYRGPIPRANLFGPPQVPNYVDPGAAANAAFEAASANGFFSWPTSWSVAAMVASAQLPPAPPYSFPVPPLSGEGSIAAQVAQAQALQAAAAANALAQWQGWPANGWASASGLVEQYAAALAVFVAGGGVPVITSTAASSIGANSTVLTIDEVLASATASALFDTLVLPNYPYAG